MEKNASPTFADWKAADAEARAAHRAICSRIAQGTDPAPTRAEIEDMWRLVARAHNLMVDYLAGVKERSERRKRLAVRMSRVAEAGTSPVL